MGSLKDPLKAKAKLKNLEIFSNFHLQKSERKSN